MNSKPDQSLAKPDQSLAKPGQSLSKPDQSPPSAEEPLLRHMKDVAASDINPWVNGYGGEVFSKSTAEHPQVDRHVSIELSLSSDGWLTADSLYLAAEIAESRQSSLVELSGPERSLRLLTLCPEGKDVPWTALRKSGLIPKASPAKTRCCPFWGPCLGRKSYLYEALDELLLEFEPVIKDDFLLELAGCPQDCRQATARADLALIFDVTNLSFEIWLGGRHRPFRESVLPYRWLKEDLGDMRRLLDVVFKVYDLWKNAAAPAETLPEAVKRIGLERFENLMATGYKVGRRRSRPGTSLKTD
ncbi:MAG: hypothetical protein LBT62_03375 [Deltaproteobacteria bacterium]|jgi:dissimilatory sulfite reductase (desulfoviridin) alpha/beta subunit|nr:hypothetical protein [Deltaproteobacteria bacterium]